MCPCQHLLSDNNSNHASWYRDNDWKAILSTVQGSDSCIPLGEFLYSGPYINTNRFTEQIQKMRAIRFPEPIHFGCQVSKNLDIKLVDVPYWNWMLAENQLIKVEVDQKDVKRLKAVLYAFINTQKDFWCCPGQYKIQFLPDKAQMLSGSKGANAHLQTLRKHAAVIKSLTILKTEDIKHLYEPIPINGTVYLLWSFLINLTSPLVPPSEGKALTMFHSIDLPSSGQDHG